MFIYMQSIGGLINVSIRPDKIADKAFTEDSLTYKRTG